MDSNFAYIDGANLYNSIKASGWELDYERFRVWLRDKYRVERACIFLGLIPKCNDLYTHLQQAGFTLIFKEVIYDNTGKAKGNCDADLVLQATRDAYENKLNKAVIVSSDGDYACLVKFLLKKEKMGTLLSPAITEKCSILLKRTGVKIAYLEEQRSILECIQKEKTPSQDKLSKGSFRKNK